ncbi:hypothetical protein OHV05_15000 [Kitasatospora sp. NBC_00070]|uniref:hypothetical protein n=1 Tax=Kitasatospora sp. NBC_00070 TaxID=2975962 RepID=UPI0032441B98
MTWPIELDLPARMVIPGIAAFARADRPDTPLPGDGNEWTTGRCWLYCAREHVPVLWIGPVTVASATAPMFACASCISRLSDLLWDDLLVGSARPMPAAPTTPALAEVTLFHRAPALGPAPPARARTSHRRPRRRTELLAATLPGWLSRLSRRNPTQPPPCPPPCTSRAVTGPAEKRSS